MVSELEKTLTFAYKTNTSRLIKEQYNTLLNKT